MLSSSALDRASCAYRAGYRDGHDRSPRDQRGERGTFAYHDYAKGYDAGLNDRYWSDYLSGQTQLSRDEYVSAHR